jgi:acetyl esterase/lipase
MSLDPDCAKVLELYAAAKRPAFETLSPAEAREASNRGRAILQPDPPVVASVRELKATGRTGNIPVRLYRPVGSSPGEVLPVLVYYHGGGWVIGDLESHDVFCRTLCNESGAAVASVGYRLAPEHPYPAAVDDAFDALGWIAANGPSLGIDATRIAVGGDSAGGNLAAVASLMARNAGNPRICLQLLIYPATDFTVETESFRLRATVMPLTAATMVWFRNHYFGAKSNDLGVTSDWRASPARAASHRGLPATYIITAGYDVLADEGRAYGDLLTAAGVPVETVHFPGAIHGFITMGRIVKSASVAGSGAAAALRRAFAA